MGTEYHTKPHLTIGYLALGSVTSAASLPVDLSELARWPYLHFSSATRDSRYRNHCKSHLGCMPQHDASQVGDSFAPLLWKPFWSYLMGEREAGLIQENRREQA